MGLHGKEFMNNKLIDASLVHYLVANQFPQWKDLPVKSVAHGGWDNRTFHLGNDMLVRMPSGAEYAPKVAKEQYWLPKLAPQLPLPIPVPLAMGMPAEGYPYHWSIYRWLDGESAAVGHINNLSDFATDLAQFLIALQQIDTSGGPTPGPDTTSRGGPLKIYDGETQQALDILKDKIDIDAATEIWQAALATTWQRPPVWVHGDVSADNLLVKDGKLSAVIDFGGLVVGDPACDLAIAWTFFEGESREVFRKAIALDTGTWARGRGWALWKALIVAAGLTETNAAVNAECWNVIDIIINEHKNHSS